MLAEVIINRGTLEFQSLVKSGKSELLSPGDYKLDFESAYQDADYEILLIVLDSDGIPCTYTLGELETDGFNITLHFESIVQYITNKS